jgi:hypothetical protein
MTTTSNQEKNPFDDVVVIYQTFFTLINSIYHILHSYQNICHYCLFITTLTLKIYKKMNHA